MTIKDPICINLRQGDELLTDDNRLPVKNPVPLDIRYDTDDSAPIYLGLNFDSYNADESALTWSVFKFSYSGTNVTRTQRRDNVAWSNRAALF